MSDKELEHVIPSEDIVSSNNTMISKKIQQLIEIFRLYPNTEIIYTEWKPITPSLIQRVLDNSKNDPQ